MVPESLRPAGRRLRARLARLHGRGEAPTAGPGRGRRRLVWAAAGIAAVLALTGMTIGSGAAGVELLANGTFEGTGSGSLAGWTGVAATLSLASDGAGGGFAGKASIGGKGSYGFKSSPLAVSKSTAAGSVYAGNGMIRSDMPGKKACLRLIELSAKGATLAYAETCVTTQSTWQAFPTVSYSAHGSGDSINFRVLQSSGVAGESFEVDNLSLSTASSNLVPAAPTNLQATAVSSSEIDLSWTASTTSGVSGYQVNRDGAALATIAAPAGSVVSYQDTGLGPGASHAYTVQTLAGSQASPASNQASATTPTAPTGANLLSNPTFEGTGSGSLSGWTKVSSTLTLAHDGVGGGYAARAAFLSSKSFGIIAAPRPVNRTSTAGTIYTATGQIRSDTPGKGVCLRLFEVTPGGSTVAFKEQCVTAQSSWQPFPSVSYTAQAGGDSIAFRILQSAGASGNSFEVDNLSLTAGSAQQAPAAPTGLTATTVSTSEIDVSWAASTSSGVTGYQVNRDGSSVATLGAGATGYNDTGLGAGTSHTYTVQALAGGVASDPTASASATTRPAAPTGLQADAVSESEIDLSWTASSTSSVDGYQVSRRRARAASTATR